MNIFRVAFSMERLVPDSLAGPVADEYFQDLVEVRPSLLPRIWALTQEKQVANCVRRSTALRPWVHMQSLIRIIMDGSMYP
jgi:hypothetical protein